MGVSQVVWLFVRGLFAGRAALLAENLALRQQLIVLQRSVKCPKLGKRDRIFWVWLSRLWSGWQSALTLVRRAFSGAGSHGSVGQYLTIPGPIQCGGWLSVLAPVSPPARS